MAAPAIQYRVECTDRRAHLFGVTLTVAHPAALQRVELPVWIPGSYLVREFSKNLQNLRAAQGRRRLAVHQIDKCSWQIECTPGKPLELFDRKFDRGGAVPGYDVSPDGQSFVMTRSERDSATQVRVVIGLPLGPL